MVKVMTYLNIFLTILISSFSNAHVVKAIAPKKQNDHDYNTKQMKCEYKKSSLSKFH
jgi:hypothetical protein